MLVDEKPSLDEDLLAHYGIPGMKWGHRKPDYIPVGRPSGVNYGPQKMVRPAKNPSKTAARPQYVQQPKARPAQKQGMSTGKKVAIGVGVVGGAAAAAYFLSKSGTRPMARSLTARSNRAGLKMTMSVLKNSGKVSVKGIKVGAKTTKVAGKVGFKTSKVVGKAAGRGAKTVAKNSYDSGRQFIEDLKHRPPTPQSKIRGEKFGKLLLGEYGPKVGAGKVNGVANMRLRRRR